ncbi:MAG: 5-formyltetrahydrofolate cyclo-ligase [Gallionella sp.]|nr:5-formyltetrahydrofolate cyclo-ligase [Gallionella sp.]
MSALNSQSTKQQIRQGIIALREQLSPEVRVAHSAAITERLLQLPSYQHANVVLGYMNFGAEFDSSAWAKQVLADGKRLALPKVNRQTNQLDLYWVEDLASQLAAGVWGIPEPVAERCERLNTLNEVEFALLPGVAFTRSGARLGYGGGFYDKLLAQIEHRPTLVAAAFGLQVVEDMPQEATDVKIEWVVIEQEVVDCSV